MVIPAQIYDRIFGCVERQAKFLLGRQIIVPADPHGVEELDGVPAVRSGELVLQTARLAENPGYPGLVKIGLSGDVHTDPASTEKAAATRRNLKARQQISSKIARYLLSDRPHKLRRILGYGFGRVRDQFYRPMGPPHNCIDTAWALVPGVNFWQAEDAHLVCIDRGAVYETYLTTHGSPYPSQVGSDLYSNACAAYLFRFMWERTGEPVWRISKEDMGHYLADLFKYPRQRLEFDSREFKFGPIFLTYGNDAAAAYGGSTNYDPVNVFGLRYYNLSLVYRGSVLDRLKKFIIAYVVARNQTGEGLLADNFRGANVESSDLTYHCYCLAMLCLGNAGLRSRFVDSVICRALHFSLEQQLANGEVSYYGRGANNIYHLASFITALCYGATRLSLDVAPSLERAVDRLAAFQQADGGWPTCMNRMPPEHMVGWHGSAVQYGALSAFLMALGLKTIDAAGSDRREPRPRVPRTAGAPVRHCKLARANVEVALTAGGNRKAWDKGVHESGYAGVSGLTVDGTNIWLTNEKGLEPERGPVLTADIQMQSGRSRAWLRRTDGARAEIGLRDRGERVHYTYDLIDGGLSVTVAASRPVVHALALQGRLTSLEAEAKRCRCRLESGLSVTISADWPFEVESVPVVVNPQGAGFLLRLLTSARQVTFEQVFRSGTC